MLRKLYFTYTILVIGFFLLSLTDALANNVLNKWHKAKHNTILNNIPGISPEANKALNSSKQIQSTFTRPFGIVPDSSINFFGTNLVNNPIDGKYGEYESVNEPANIAKPNSGLSSSVTLNSLTTSSGTLSPSFISGTYAYTVNVTNLTNSITVTPTLTDPLATVTVKGIIVTSGTASSALPLNVGNNTIPVVVTGSDGKTQQTYTLTVNRAASAVCTLSGITASTSTSAGYLNLIPSTTDIFTYNGFLTSSYSSLYVTATPTENNATITVTANGTNITPSSGFYKVTSLNFSPIVNNIVIVVTAQDGITKQKYYLNITHPSLPSVTSLSSLTVSDGTLSPGFVSGTGTYYDYLPNSVSTISITPTLTDALASVTINGTLINSGTASNPFTLAAGGNTFFIVVTAEDGLSKQTYTLNVYRTSAGSALLSNMVFSSGSLTPIFNSVIGNYNYSSSVPNTTVGVTVTPTVNVTGATVMVNGIPVSSGVPSSSIPLNVGPNTIITSVTASDHITTQTYTTTITRQPSTVATLNNLTTSPSSTLSPTFAVSTTSYTDNVVNSLTSIDLIPTVSDATATVIVKMGTTIITPTTIISPTSSKYTIPLIVGNNTVTILVTAQDGNNTQTYTLIVKRAASTVATLSTLGISGGGTLSPATFVSSITNYTYVVSNSTSSITLTPTVTDATATVTVNGITVTSGNASSPLALGFGTTTIATVVTAQDGSTKQTYTLTILRPSNVATLNNLVPSIGAFDQTFLSTTFAYTQTVSNAISSITLTPTITPNSNATIKINGVSATSGSAVSIALAVGANIVNIVVTAQDGITQQTYTVTVTRASNVATLQTISVSAGALSPTFLSTITSYTQTVSNATTSITVTPTVTNATATVIEKLNGNTVATGSAVPLNVGNNNVITFDVTSQDGSTKQTYTVTVTRASNDATLQTLLSSAGALSPTFPSATIFAYTQTVSNAISSITLTPTTTNSYATIKINGLSVTSGTATSIALGFGDNIVNIVVTAQDGITQQTYTLTVTRVSNVATLQNLFSTAGALSPTFLSTITSYTQTVSNATTSITVTPTVTDATATVIEKLNGNTITIGSAVSLNVGNNNIITFTVTAQDGTTKTYTLTVTRLSNDATLSGLIASVGSISPALVSGTYSYTDVVSNSTTSITVTPTTTDGFATVLVNGNLVTSGSASSAIPLVFGNNAIKIDVTSQDLSTKNTYTINVVRTPLTIATLNTLAVSNGTLSPGFSSDIYSYTDNVSNSLSSITVTPTLTDLTSSVKVNGNAVTSNSPSSITLLAGNTTIKIDVTAQDGITTKTYILTVTKLSSDASLMDLQSSAGLLYPLFSSTKISYTQTVSNATTSITITPKVTDATATVKVNGADVTSGTGVVINLVDGDNTINVAVTAQDGITKQTYTLVVTRPSTDATLSNLAPSTGAFDQSFKPSTFAYTQTVSNVTANISITPTVTQSNATLKVNGLSVSSGTATSIPLSVGDNAINIVVTAPDGTTKQTYTLTVTRASSAASLQSLTVTSAASSVNLLQTFNSGITTYNLNLSNGTSVVTVTPTLTDKTMTLVSVSIFGKSINSTNNTSYNIPLFVGNNEIEILISALDGTKNTYILNISRSLSTDNTLSGLGVNSGKLSPAFASGVTNYDDNVPNETSEIVLLPIANDTTATININGHTVQSGTVSTPMLLQVGLNTVTINVTAQDGTSKVYTIRATRAQSSVATLSNLKVSNNSLDPGFDDSTYFYKVNVRHSTASVTITPTVTNPNATVTVNGVAVNSSSTSSPILLNDGNNPIKIEVTAQDGTIKDDTVNVRRPPSGGAILSNLTISNGSLMPGFDYGTLSYTDTVTSQISSITITPTANETTSVVKVNGILVTSGVPSSPIILALGDNTITTEVTAQDGLTKQIYTILVTRLKSSVSTLSNLRVSTGTLSPVFNSGTTSYLDNLPNSINVISVTPDVTDASASVSVNGTSVPSGTASLALPLNVGSNPITIVVTAQDNSIKTYTLTVNRAPSDRQYLVIW